MIASLTGTLVSKSPTEAVIGVHGVGFDLKIPVTTFETLPDPGSTVTLHTHLHVRDDALELYGFATLASRSMFRTLLSVSGIGPRMALGILSKLDAAELGRYILGGNPEALTSLPGIGRKLADRLIVELRDKISRTEVAQGGESRPGKEVPDDARSQAILALTSLGFSRPAAEKAVQNAIRNIGVDGSTTESIVKAALQFSQR